jgi:hypothetical protein
MASGQIHAWRLIDGDGRWVKIAQPRFRIENVAVTFIK